MEHKYLSANIKEDFLTKAVQGILQYKK